MPINVIVLIAILIIISMLVGSLYKNVPGIPGLLLIGITICLLMTIGFVLLKSYSNNPISPKPNTTTNTYNADSFSGNIIDHLPTTNDINMVVLPDSALNHKLRYLDTNLIHQIQSSKKVYQKGYYYLDDDICMEIKIYKIVASTNPKLK